MSVSQSDSASTPANGRTQESAGLWGRGLAGAVAGGGVLLTGLCAGGLLFDGLPGAGPSGASEISIVAADELGGASGTLDPQQASALASQARGCRSPLAMVILSKAPGAPDSDVRIRSGGYLSPAFRVGDTPVRVAIPFPAPYLAGRGRLVVEGPRQGLRVALYPAWQSASMQKADYVNVWWRTDKPCG